MHIIRRRRSVVVRFLLQHFFHIFVVVAVVAGWTIGMVGGTVTDSTNIST